MIRHSMTTFAFVAALALAAGCGSDSTTAPQQVTRTYNQVQRLGNLGIKIGLNAKSEHGGSDCHVEELDPEVHLSEGGAHIVGAADDVRGELSGRGQLSAKLLS